MSKVVKTLDEQSFKVTVPGVQSKNAEGIPVSVGFTKENELFVGRVAMIGFAAALVGYDTGVYLSLFLALIEKSDAKRHS